MADTPGRYASSGGFLPPSLPSPAMSTASSRAAAGLPKPRSKPLLPGSRKEDYAREYVSQRLLHISRRFVKKHAIPDPTDTVSGYPSFDEACKDLEEVVDVLWFSGTPSLQVPYLLNVALAVTEYLPSFPPSPRPTFALLKKLDHCFASLLSGKDIRTQNPLPGFEQGLGRGMTRTDMVRCRSLVDETRIQVAVKMSDENDVDTYLPEEGNDIPTSPSSGKRKLDDQDDEHTRATLSPKRQRTASPSHIKIESPSGDNRKSATPSGVGATRYQSEGNAGAGGQFHWALDEDSDDTDGDEDPAASVRDSAQIQQTTPPPSGLDPHEESPPGDRVIHHLQDPAADEDDEELHMNVAKVYEKTIIQLGKSLGEILVDE